MHLIIVHEFAIQTRGLCSAGSLPHMQHLVHLTFTPMHTALGLGLTYNGCVLKVVLFCFLLWRCGQRVGVCVFLSDDGLTV